MNLSLLGGIVSFSVISCHSMSCGVTQMHCSSVQTKAVDELAAAGLRNAVRVEVKAVAVAAAASSKEAGAAAAGRAVAAADRSHGRGRQGEASTQGNDSGGDGGGALKSNQPSSLATPPELSLEVRQRIRRVG